jgi:hypothetical protein
MRFNRLYGRWHQGHVRGTNPFSAPVVCLAVSRGVVVAKPSKLAVDRPRGNTAPVMVPALTRNGGWGQIPVKVLLHVHNPNRPNAKPGNVISKSHDLATAPRLLCAVPARDRCKSRNDRRHSDWQRQPFAKPWAL